MGDGTMTGRGWYNESSRHSLAARGIPTTMRARGDAYMEYRNKSCEERIDTELAGTIEDLRRVWNAYNGESDPDYDEESLYDYGLSFDYVMPHTFGDEQKEGHFRYQLSWGGPSDEFRFYVGPGYKVYRIEYVFQDWFDGAKRTLSGDDYDLLLDIYQWFDDLGATENEYDKSREDY
jgi:hypothetical protein